MFRHVVAVLLGLPVILAQNNTCVRLASYILVYSKIFLGLLTRI